MTSLPLTFQRLAVFIFSFHGLALAAVAAAQSPTPVEPQTMPEHTLLLVDLQGCPDCIAFKRQARQAYIASDLGDLAPLVQIEIRELAESEYWHVERPKVFPTFVLLDANQEELDRIVGYNGADFFWGYIDSIFRKHRVFPAQ